MSTVPVTAIVPTGSGAITVHRQLASLLPNYEVVPYAPWLEYTPWRLRRFRPGARHVVHCPPDHATMVAGEENRLVVTFHNYVLDAGMYEASSALQRLHYATDLRWFTRRSLRRASHVTAVSEATSALVREDLGYRGHIEVIPNSVDAHRFSPPASGAAANDSQARVLYCGTPSRRKGFHWLPDIARGIAGHAELICATGARQVAMPSQGLRLLGAVPPHAMPDLYRNACVFLMPSLREGMSLALLEAMATALPTVAWDTPSSRETLGEHQYDLLAPYGDIDGLVSRLRWVLDHPTQARAIGISNRARAIERNAPRTMANRYWAVLTAAAG